MNKTMNEKYTKWVACWGNALSITDRKESTFSKNLTLRYPLKVCFSGSKLRFHFNNITGTEDVTLTKVTVAKSFGKNSIDTSTLTKVTFDGKDSAFMTAGGFTVSDEIDFNITAGEDIAVNIYLGDFTQMNSGVSTIGPLSKAFFSYGDFSESENLPADLTRPTHRFYFMDTIDVLTEEKNHALICYGDSITAQSWPEYLSLRTWEEGYNNVSIIRRAASGTRILDQYDCITYQSYGIKGSTRFPYEIVTAGADAVIIQHGINDIIHPVGYDVNEFRPWRNLPTSKEMADGIVNLYVNHAKELGLKVYGGTLLPIWGWRTYAEFRDLIRQNFNDWIRTYEGFDGVVDFDEAVRSTENPKAFGEGMDSGDHLHPSEKAYKLMAYTVPKELF